MLKTGSYYCCQVHIYVRYPDSVSKAQCALRAPGKKENELKCLKCANLAWRVRRAEWSEESQSRIKVNDRIKEKIIL